MIPSIAVCSAMPLSSTHIYLPAAGGVVDLDGTDPYNASDLLKMYFRELPEPLLTYELYNELIALKTTKESNQAYTDGLRELLGKLPLPNQTLLQYVVHFLCRISFSSEVNRMSPSNIALVFGPELIRPKFSSPVPLFQKADSLLQGGNTGITPNVWQDSTPYSNPH